MPSAPVNTNKVIGAPGFSEVYWMSGPTGTIEPARTYSGMRFERCRGLEALTAGGPRAGMEVVPVGTGG